MGEVGIWSWHGLVMGQGRLRRGGYWATFGALFGTLFALGIAIGVLHMTQTLNVLGLGLNFVTTWLTISTLARRLHDLGRSGWWMLTFLLAAMVLGGVAGVAGPSLGWRAPPGQIGQLMGALLYFVTVIVLGCLPGQPDANRFGGRRVVEVFG